MAETPSQGSIPLLQALKRVAGGQAGESAAAEVEMFRLRVGGAPFAVESGLVHEVVRTPPVTPLPNAPPFLVGVAAHRGDVVAVVDLAKLLNRGETAISGRSRLAIARWEGMVVGLLAEEVLGLGRFPTAALQPAPLGTESNEFVSGIILEGQPMGILDLRRALASARERAAAGKR